MKIPTAIAMMPGNWMKLNVFMVIMFLQCECLKIVFIFTPLGALNVKIVAFRMDIDYSPTGREFVTGSYDRTVSYY